MNIDTDPRYVSFPGIVRTHLDEGMVRLENPATGTQLEGGEDLETLVDLFAEPTALSMLQEEFGLDADDLAPFERNLMIVKEDELPFLRRGLLRPSTSPPLGAKCDWAELLERARPGDAVVFGAPVEGAAGGQGGARHGPREIRHAAPNWLRDAGDVAREVMHIDLGRRYLLGDRQVLDIGDLTLDPDETYAEFGARISKVVDSVVAHGQRPILLGGDHSVSWFALSPLLDRFDRLGVLHFDAHHDLYPMPAGQLRHLNPFDFVCRHKNLAALVQIGLRTSEAPPPDADPVTDDRIRCVSSYALRRGGAQALLDSLDRDIPWYLSFDVDCLDPAVAPETGTTVVGGMGYYDALEIVDFAASKLQVIGADFVEVTDGPRRINQAAHIVGELLGLCALGDTPTEPLDTYYYRSRDGLG